MNNLPTSRQVIYGRTWARSWDPSDMDPVQFWPRKHSRLERMASIGLALFIGVSIGVTLVVWASQ